MKTPTNLLYLSVKRSKTMTDAKNGRKNSIREIEKHVKMYKSQGRCFESQSITVQRGIAIIEIIIITIIIKTTLTNAVHSSAW